MKAIQIHEFGGPEVLTLEEVEMPVPKKNEVLVEVHASSLNPVDAKSIQKNSRYASMIHFPMTPGMDIAGVVRRVGEGVSNIQEGDKVFGQASALRHGSGAFAEFAVTSEDAIARMPENINFVEAASLPLTAASAYEALDYMALQQGQKVLIHGGSGGIGSLAIQLAKLRGAYVITTASGEGISFAKALGADEVIDYRSGNVESQLKDLDAVLDTVGGETYTKSFQVLKRGGIIVSMLMPPDENLMKQYGVRAVLEMTRVDRNTLSEIAALVEEGALKIHVNKVYPLEETERAYREKKEKKVLGKIAIEIRHN
jgi:2-desacetyl-2-hydroxyethyl bacteriochlorophyllide A dehydrogenase